MEMVVHRTRKTRRQWELAAETVSVQTSCLPVQTKSERTKVAIAFEFEIASAGGGATVIRLSAVPAAWGEIIEAMMRVNAKATREAVAYAESLEYEEEDMDDLPDVNFG